MWYAELAAGVLPVALLAALVITVGLTMPTALLVLATLGVCWMVVLSGRPSEDDD